MCTEHQFQVNGAQRCSVIRQTIVSPPSNIRLQGYDEIRGYFLSTWVSFQTPPFYFSQIIVERFLTPWTNGRGLVWWRLKKKSFYKYNDHGVEADARAEEEAENDHVDHYGDDYFGDDTYRNCMQVIMWMKAIAIKRTSGFGSYTVVE